MNYSSNLKMKEDHFYFIKNKIEMVLNASPNALVRYELGRAIRGGSARSLKTRFCYDVLRVAVGSSWVSDNLYPYLDDENILSALKRIFPPG